MSTEAEQWRPVVGFEGLYAVSDQGRIMSFHHSPAGRIIRGSRGRKYDAVLMRINGTYHAEYIHRLVLMTFVGEAPPGMVCCHNNGDHCDNRLSNLRWDTYLENTLDIVRHGRHVGANKTHCKWGHEFNEENTVIRRDGGRLCRPCNIMRGRERRARLNAA